MPKIRHKGKIKYIYTYIYIYAGVNFTGNIAQISCYVRYFAAFDWWVPLYLFTYLWSCTFTVCSAFHLIWYHYQFITYPKNYIIVSHFVVHNIGPFGLWLCTPTNHACSIISWSFVQSLKRLVKLKRVSQGF